MGRFSIVLLALLVSSFTPINFRGNLLVDLPINEGSGLLAFERTKNTNGIGISPITTCTWSQGLMGKSLLWGAPNTNKINLGKPNCLNFTQSKCMTISVWVVFTDISAGVNSGYRYICSDYNSSVTNAQFALVMLNTQKISFFWANAGTQAPAPLSSSGATSVTTGKLYHLVGVRSGAAGAWTTAIYLNGNYDGGTTTATNPATQANSGNCIVGQPGDYTGALGMVGFIKDLKIWDKPFTATDVRRLYESELKNINQP